METNIFYHINHLVLCQVVKINRYRDQQTLVGKLCLIIRKFISQLLRKIFHI